MNPFKLPLLLLLGFSFGSLSVSASEELPYEQSLLQSISAIKQLDHEQAMAGTREFIEHYPTSKVGQMLYADLLLARAEMLPRIGHGINRADDLEGLTQEIRLRLSHQHTPAYDGLIPQNLLHLADNQPYYLLLDQSQSRLYVYRNDNGRPQLQADYFLSIGLKGPGKQKRGDQKTPIGIYHVTSYIDDAKLPDLYGSGAFPVNYPNSWDKRKQRTGDGIWIHGSPSDTYNRAPLSSNGCMVVSNPDFVDLKQYIQPELNTPVVVVESIQWMEPVQWQQQQQQLLKQFNRWLGDWQSRQHDRYIEHYSPEQFRSAGRDFKQWDRYKQRVNGNKQFIDIDFANLSIYQYPGEDGLVLMQYEQYYRSSNFNNDSAKEIYWKRHDQDWKIVYEGSRKVRLAATAR